MSRVLVTGGAGFIGSRITDKLIEKGFKVSVVDDLSTGRRENLSDEADFTEIDLCSPKLIEVFRGKTPDYVIHEAAQVNVRKSVEDPLFDARTNVLGSLNLLECCRKVGVKKIVYASSGGAVYGEPVYMPVDEKHPVNPVCPYGASKHTVEHYLRMYELNFGLDYTVLRYSNVYGPRQDPDGEAGVIAIFTRKLLSGESPTIFGDGKQTRDFVYVEDVAEANLAALTKKTGEKVFNVGSGKESSINDITLKLATTVKSSVKPNFMPEVKGEVRRIYLNINLAREKLNWNPKTSLDEGLKKTVEYFKKK